MGVGKVPLLHLCHAGVPARYAREVAIATVSVVPPESVMPRDGVVADGVMADVPHVSVPADAAIRVEVMDSGSGSLHLPGALTLISGDNKTGVWESTNYSQATTRILIQIINQGSGSISIN